MSNRVFPLAAIALCLLVPAQASAEDVEGLVIIKRRLTKPRVTATAAAYQRGTAVELAAVPESDPLAVERGRVAIYLEGPPPESSGTPASGAISMEQRGRQFFPDTLVIPAGTTVSFPNLDPIFHNVFSLSKPKEFDLGSYAKDRSRNVTFPKAGIVFVNCHLHPNMGGVIVVTPNRWSAKADGAGKFVLKDVPPGTYTIVAWHKAAGFFRETIHVVEGHTATAQFFIPLGAEEVPRTTASR